MRSTIELGHNLDLRMVAEGVEDLPTAQQLVALGCDRLQGYLLGRPAPASEVPSVIERMRPLHALLHEAATGARRGRSGRPVRHGLHAVPPALPAPRDPEKLPGERKVSS